MSKLLKLVRFVPAAIAVGLMAILAWFLLVPEVHNPPGTISLQAARAASKLPLPASAENIRLASYRRWSRYLMYVKFDAPMKDRQAFAQNVLENWRLAHCEGTSQPAELADWTGPGREIRDKHLDVSWFDVQRVARGQLAGGGGGGRPTIWIDADSNACYYRISSGS